MMVKTQRTTLASFKTALSGLFYAFKTQKNLRIGAGAGFLVLLLSLFLNLPLEKFVIIVLAVFLFLSAEMINTSIEEVVNLLTCEWKKQAEIAKDVTSGMVLLIVIETVIVGLLVFAPYFKNLLTR